MTSYTTTHYDPAAGMRVTRTYWVQTKGGYVYDVTDAPGTTGRQVSYCLSGSGDMMTCDGSAVSLRAVVQQAQRRRLREWRARGVRS